MSKVNYQQVRVGGFYVNEAKGLVREVVANTGGGYFNWLSYSLPSGQPAGDSGNCSAEHITRWATREATEEEYAIFQRDKAHSDHSARWLERAHSFLNEVPDAMLLAEVNRRGLYMAPREQ